jgi:hypothetical protein
MITSTTLALALIASSLVAPDELVVTRSAVVLHAGPGANHPGVLELPAAAVLRRGATRGTFTEVTVPQGFPVYLHGDFAQIDRDEATAVATGSRVNLRLLPSTAGTVPVGQVGTDDGALVLLDEEGGWLRVLAPLDVTLYAPEASLGTATARSASQWDIALRSREARRGSRSQAREFARPGWLDELRTQHEVEYLARRSLPGMTDLQLGEYLDELDSYAQRSASLDSRALITSLTVAAQSERQRRSANVAAVVRQREASEAKQQALELEARTLSVGLEFRGKGEDVTITGLVSRLATGSAQLSIYSISDARGRRYKLSAPRDVADLATLVEKNVTLRGRSLQLANVSGSVLIIDQVNDIRP